MRNAISLGVLTTTSSRVGYNPRKKSYYTVTRTRTHTVSSCKTNWKPWNAVDVFACVGRQRVLVFISRAASRLHAVVFAITAMCAPLSFRVKGTFSQTLYIPNTNHISLNFYPVIFTQKFHSCIPQLHRPHFGEAQCQLASRKGRSWKYLYVKKIWI